MAGAVFLCIEIPGLSFTAEITSKRAREDISIAVRCGQERRISVNREVMECARTGEAASYLTAVVVSLLLVNRLNNCCRSNPGKQLGEHCGSLGEEW